MRVKAVLALSGTAIVGALDNGLGARPPMGWNSWNLAGCAINETFLRRRARGQGLRGSRL